MEAMKLSCGTQETESLNQFTLFTCQGHYPIFTISNIYSFWQTEGSLIQCKNVRHSSWWSNGCFIIFYRCSPEFLGSCNYTNRLSSSSPRDALIVSITNSFTSILAGFVIFSAIGYMAHTHNLPVENIATDGKHQAWENHRTTVSESCFILMIEGKCSRNRDGYTNCVFLSSSWEHFFLFSMEKQDTNFKMCTSALNIWIVQVT